jgi:hypothetical protein
MMLSQASALPAAVVTLMLLVQIPRVVCRAIQA